jgi:hypothetical protein
MANIIPMANKNSEESLTIDKKIVRIDVSIRIAKKSLILIDKQITADNTNIPKNSTKEFP